jgi:hypothetical protein
MMTSQNIDRKFLDEDNDVLPDRNLDNVAAFSLGAGAPNNIGCCQNKHMHVNSGNDKKVLFMLSIGLRFNIELLVSIGEDPCSTLE